jgi:selenide,water dikinase
VILDIDMLDAAIRLTAFASGGGCATKIGQADLAGIMASLPLPRDVPQLLVGAATGDDAAVYRLRDDLALVLTTDFFAPVVDDPADYGAIAAANALSDVYAMGGTPLLALNIVAWPQEDVLPASVLERVLLAGAAVCAEAGALVVGGHSIRDAEPKYGLAVVGTVHPDAVTTNAAGRPGLELVLTKPLGTGIVANATKLDLCSVEVTGAAVRSMRALNRDAGAAAAAAGVRCATDVTGFGLLGHARSMARASGCAVEINAMDLPLLPGVEELVAAGTVPGGSRRNLAFAETWTRWGPGVDELRRVVATDAQTSGGLLLAVEPAATAGLVEDIVDRGGAAWRIGQLVEGPPEPLRVT